MTEPVIFTILQTGARANGGLQSITEVMRRLKTHRPVILTNLDSDLSRQWQSDGFKVQVEAEQASSGLRRNPGGYARAYWRYHRSLRGLIAKTGARVVHANDPLAFQMSLSAVKTAPRTRIALNLRDTLDPDRRPPRLKYRLLFAAADHVFYLSRDMAERWRRIAPNATRACSVTYSIVDPVRFSASAVEAAGRPVVLVSGIFRPKKGQLEFIRGVVPVLAAADVETWFAGDFDPGNDPYAAACAAAAQPHAEHVRFLGYRDDLPDLIKQASVVAIPSRHEGLMRGMIEAMSCGRPVVSFDVCSAREVIEEEAYGAGAVLRLGNYEDMAAALLRYARDPEVRAAAGRAGSEAARLLFDADRVVERYERVYRALGRA